MKKNRILVVDTWNLFIRNYVADPSICADGSPCGGLKGTLKSLQKIIREVGQVDKVFFVWDGKGGSQRRKKLHSKYKDGRKPIKLNRNVHNLSEKQEAVNKVDQLHRLFEYLDEIPIIQFSFENVEADDVIAEICSSESLKGQIKIIVSSDKDFIQLCNDDTILYRPAQKHILNKGRVLKEYGVHPNNFALARAIVGDPSDNLPGVRMVGPKTVASKLPFLAESKSYTIDEVIEFAEERKEDSKAYSQISEARDIIEFNYKLMQLYSPLISSQVARTIKRTIADFVPEFNQTSITCKMATDGFTDYNWQTLFQSFRYIVAESKNP